MRWFSLSLFTALSLSFAAPVFAGDLPRLEEKLNGPMEALLKQQNHREVIGFNGDFKALSKDCETCGSYQLTIPKHVQRDTFMDVTLSFANHKPVLKGRMFDAAQKALLTQHVAAIYGKVDDHAVEVFPFQQIAKDYAIANKKAVNLYVKPQAVAGDNLATQMRLGMAMQVLDISSDKRFALVHLEDDGYIAWVERKDIQEGDAQWYSDWKKHQQVLVMAELPTMHYGTRLKLVKQDAKHIWAALPDSKTIMLSKNDAQVHTQSALPSSEAILSTAKQYLPKGPYGGGTYLWGGTLGKRLDCSGFVQTTYRMNGVFLPRDADQQKGFTQRVGNTLAQLDELKAGDLVFFSGNGKYPTHVGLYIGNNQVIHSSAKGPYDGVKINSLRGGGSYDQYLQKIYFGGGRVVRSL
jgi:gamma-D-glutamyl-L-lysine dipeptidyl-peptidase